MRRRGFHLIYTWFTPDLHLFTPDSRILPSGVLAAAVDPSPPIPPNPLPAVGRARCWARRGTDSTFTPDLLPNIGRQGSLQIAARGGYDDVARVLIEARADVNNKDGVGVRARKGHTATRLHGPSALSPLPIQV